MWSLPKPDISKAATQLEAVLPSTATPPVLSKAHRAAVAALYVAYENRGGRPVPAYTPDGLDAPARAALLAAYSEVRDGGKLSSLRSELMLEIDVCPYCSFGEVRDLDHHLPKARFNCFSIFPLNLVPSCAKCNGHKPRKPKEAADKHHIHAYLDDLSAYDFLVADVTLSKSALSVNFRIQQPAGMSNELHARLIQHLVDFKLNRRLRAQINLLLFSQATSLKNAHKTGGKASVKQFLEDVALDHDDLFGPNDWRSALFKALAAHAEFCDGGFKRVIARKKKRLQPGKAPNP